MKDKNREIINLVRSSNRKLNCIVIYPNNNFEHEDVKCQICNKLHREGWNFYTECIFLNNSRADILVFQNGVGYCIEVLHTETEEEFNEKIKKYPKILGVVKVRTKGFDIAKFSI